MKVKEESEKVELELNIQKTKIMASGRVISWQIDGETVANFSFLGSKITADDDWSNKIKRYLLLGRKVMANLYNILKSREITLPTMVHLVKAMFFPVVMYGSESWTIKKAEHQRIDAFELCCWRRLLRVPWTAGSKLSILKEISPEYSLEGLMLKLKLQYFGLLMWRIDWLEKTLILGKIEGGMGRRRQRMRCLDGITNSMDMFLSKLQIWWWAGKPGVLQSMGWQRVGHDWVTELNWPLCGHDLCDKILDFELIKKCDKEPTRKAIGCISENRTVWKWKRVFKNHPNFIVFLKRTGRRKFKSLITVWNEK